MISRMMGACRGSSKKVSKPAVEIHPEEEKADAPHSDVAVIGAGAHGAAAAYHLAKAGSDVLVLEKALPDSGDGVALRHGSSGGESRRFSLTNFSAHKSTMCQLGLQLWHEAEEEHGSTLLHHKGSIDITGHNSGPMRGILRAAAANSIPVDVMDAAAVVKRWPAFAGMGRDAVGLWNKDGGILNPVECIGAFRSMAQRHGAKLCFGEETCSIRWKSGDELFEISTHGVESGCVQRYTCGHLVLAPGAWLQPCLEMLGSAFLPTTIAEMSYGFYEVASAAKDAMNSCPVWRSFYGCGCYGFPIYEKEGWVKVAPFGCARSCYYRSAEERSHKPNYSHWNQTAGFVAELFGQNLSGEKHGHEHTCLYTYTADNEFILDSHPKFPPGRVVVSGGYCDSGFKHCALMGKAVSAMVRNDGRCSLFDIRSFSMTRSSLGANFR